VVVKPAGVEFDDPANEKAEGSKGVSGEFPVDAVDVADDFFVKSSCRAKCGVSDGSDVLIEDDVCGGDCVLDGFLGGACKVHVSKSPFDEGEGVDGGVWIVREFSGEFGCKDGEFEFLAECRKEAKEESCNSVKAWWEAVGCDDDFHVSKTLCAETMDFIPWRSAGFPSTLNNHEPYLPLLFCVIRFYRSHHSALASGC